MSVLRISVAVGVVAIALATLSATAGTVVDGTQEIVGSFSAALLGRG